MYKKIKQILNLKKLAQRLSHLIPRQHHLYGTILHRVTGERLFVSYPNDYSLAISKKRVRT